MEFIGSSARKANSAGTTRPRPLLQRLIQQQPHRVPAASLFISRQLVNLGQQIKGYHEANGDALLWFRDLLNSFVRHAKLSYVAFFIACGATFVFYK
jgi:hypothetical protein